MGRWDGGALSLTYRTQPAITIVSTGLPPAAGASAHLTNGGTSESSRWSMRVADHSSLTFR